MFVNCYEGFVETDGWEGFVKLEDKGEFENLREVLNQDYETFCFIGKHREFRKIHDISTDGSLIAIFKKYTITFGETH